MMNKGFIIRCLLVFFLVSITYFSQSQNCEHSIPYKVENGVIYSEIGLPETPLWFADSRLAFQMDEAGISQIDYHNPEESKINMQTVFLRQLWDGFRLYLEQDLKTYKPEFTNCQVWPFGYESEWNFDGVKLKHRIMAVDEAIIMQIIVPENVPENTRLKLEFYEAFGLSKGGAEDWRYSNWGTSRKWDKWEFSAKNNILRGGFISYPTAEESNPDKVTARFLCGIGADFPIEQDVRIQNPKQILKSPILEAGKTYSFIISFGSEESAFLAKNQRLVKEASPSIEKQFERYRKVADRAPVLESPNKDLNNFMSLAPMYHEALKVTDYPGVNRAKTSNFWVWGWDGMTDNSATFYWGDPEHIKNMLKFYETTADSVRGVVHCYNNKLKLNFPFALPAQGIYINLLQLYYSNTNDLNWVKERYPFAKDLFNKIAKSEVEKTGMCEGGSLYPDIVEAMGETGSDISGFNNTVFYCAARSMESLSALLGDEKQRKSAEGIVRRFEDNYLKLFFNPKKEFVVAYLDSKTLEQRNNYNISAIRWENNYCADLTEKIDAQCLNFFKQNCISPIGLREVPLWGTTFDNDANQLHGWWPVTGTYYMRLINSFNQKDLVDEWVKWVTIWSNHITCPEGISYYIETDKPEFDRWNTMHGTWNAFSVRSWYQAAIHGVIGVGTDTGGFTFYPYGGEEMILKGLNYMGRKFDIEMSGSGPYIESIEVDGKIIKGTNKLPVDICLDKQHYKVKVNRVTENLYPLFISTGTGVELNDYSFDDGKITASLSGAGLCRLKINSGKTPSVKINGKEVMVKYEPSLRIATVEVNLKPGKLQKMVINP